MDESIQLSLTFLKLSYSVTRYMAFLIFFTPSSFQITISKCGCLAAFQLYWHLVNLAVVHNHRSLGTQGWLVIICRSAGKHAPERRRKAIGGARVDSWRTCAAARTHFEARGALVLLRRRVHDPKHEGNLHNTGGTTNCDVPFSLESSGHMFKTVYRVLAFETARDLCLRFALGRAAAQSTRALSSNDFIQLH